MPSGYSGTPLPKKLGIKEGDRVAALGECAAYAEMVGPLPTGVQVVTKVTKNTHLVHLFVTRREVLEKQLKHLREVLQDNVSIWVSWPKKSSKVSTTVTEDVIRELALPLGLVDIKVCAVTEVWSGLKLVVRKELRE